MLRRIARAALQTEVARQVTHAWCERVAPQEIPWFDRAGQEEEIARLVASGKIRQSDRQYLHQWIREGYFVVKNAVPAADIDELSSFIDQIATAQPIQGLKLLGIKLSPDAPPTDISHREFFGRFSAEERLRILAAAPWRIHGLHKQHPAARRMFHNRELSRLATAVFQHTAIPLSSITFSRGSEQGLHQDMAVFHIWPRSFLLGCWIACEDIEADSGPLVFCPGSHRAPWFAAFDNYPQTNLRTASTATTHEYYSWIARESVRFEKKRFLARKGDALFWHSMLFHGGDAIARADSTRKSLVLHYVVRGSNRVLTIRGPLNW